MTAQLESIIDNAWENRASINVASAAAEVRQAVEHVIAELNGGRLRVASREGVGRWTTHQWIKKAVLLSFRLSDNVMMRSGDLGFYDKVQTKFGHLTEEEMKSTGVRVVPPAVARRASPKARS
jgi:2,3,4,5-tetrahydropyridine-2-carboxylate N-succinyltransferase